MLIWSRDAFVSALALSLIHSLWQGAILGLLGAALNARLQRTTPDIRCGAFSVLLVAVFTIWVGTFCCLYGTGVHQNALETSTPLAAATLFAAGGPTSASVKIPATAAQPTVSSIVALAQPIYPVLVGFWTLGVCLFSLRYVGGFLMLRRLCRAATHPCPPEWAAHAERLTQLMGIRRKFLLRCSAQIDVPCVFGVFRSCLLLPLGAMSGLTTAQAEALIAHELAHLARHDVALNFIQVCIETALFYHPAVRWLSSQIRIAREQHCDDLAVQHIGNRAVYARALFSLEEARVSTPRLALGANGDADTQLVQRIRRVLRVSGPEQRDPWARAMMALGAAAVGLASLQPVQSSAPNARRTSVHAAPSVRVASNPVPPRHIVFYATSAHASKMTPKIAMIKMIGASDNLVALSPIPQQTLRLNLLVGHKPKTEALTIARSEPHIRITQAKRLDTRPTKLQITPALPVKPVQPLTPQPPRRPIGFPAFVTPRMIANNTGGVSVPAGIILANQDAPQGLTDLPPAVQAKIRQIVSATGATPQQMEFVTSLSGSDSMTRIHIEINGKQAKLEDLPTALQQQLQEQIHQAVAKAAMSATIVVGDGQKPDSHVEVGISTPPPHPVLQ